MKLVSTNHVTPSRKTLHKEGCFQLARKFKNRAAPSARPIEVGEDLSDFKLCSTCFPDAPSLKILKRYCATCRTNRPCAHNGGVRVEQTLDNAFATYTRHRWVWPDSTVARRLAA